VGRWAKPLSLKSPTKVAVAASMFSGFDSFKQAILADEEEMVELTGVLLSSSLRPLTFQIKKTRFSSFID
jgi:hypothetical protein